MGSMKKAYLITAYHQPNHLRRLVRALEYSGVCFFIHIDGRVEIGPFKEALRDVENVVFIAARKINWMGFSQVESTLALMRAAAAEGCDYYTLLSGSDYPIKRNREILEFFAAAQAEYITFWKLDDRPSWRPKIEYFYPIDIVPILDYENAGFRRYFWGYFYKLRWHMPKRRFLKGVVPYGGSHWWSLSHDCVTFILRFIRENAKVVRFYKYTHCPSEMFFQTIVLNSGRASRVQRYGDYLAWSQKTSAEEKARGASMLPEDSFNLRYMDWSGERTGGHGRPAILETKDFDALKGSAELFARKFEERESHEVLARIDRELLGEDP
jgi:hypothetical protein